MNCRIWAVSFLVSFREYASFCKSVSQSGKTQNLFPSDKRWTIAG